MALAALTSVTFTRPSNTTAYTAGDVIGAADSVTPANAGSAVHLLENVTRSDRFVMLQEAQVLIYRNDIPSGMTGFRLHFYDATPAAILDNEAFNLVSADRTRWRGSVDLPTPTDLGDTIASQLTYCGLLLPVAAGTTSLFVQLQALGGWTPASGTVHMIRARFVEAGM